MPDNLVKCANCWHPKQAHTRSRPDPVSWPHGVVQFGGCAATIQGDGFSYPCDCAGFADSRYVKVVRS